MTRSEKETRYTEMLEQNRALIMRVCYMYATDREHFNDLYQETAINLWQGMDKFKGDSKLSTWIYRTTLNTCISYFRKNHKHADTSSLEGLMELPDESADRTSQLKEMYRLITRLRKLDRAIILLWLDEKSYDEIAEVTGLSRNNVASRLHRIKSQLAELAQE
ncbi:MAG: sigma-70 family RNA polymerase sigma factor [Muribaculaceae bacterium]|nr:sigma-70 family RNA polymerase sigma factor [Muribaculaceae bacterium]